MTIFHHADGTPSMHPTSQEQAKRLRRRRYDSGQNCGICLGTPLRFTSNAECVHCCRLLALDHYNKYVRDGGTLHCVENAILEKSEVYYTYEMCGKAGHVGLRNLEGACVHCLQDVVKRKNTSPRQIAKAAGARWYTPTEPCKTCGQLAERYVANGRCRGCDTPKGATVGQLEAERAFIRNYPTLVFSKARAIRGGLGVYRTGEACGHGHTTYRRVSDGGCISCS